MNVQKQKKKQQKEKQERIKRMYAQEIHVVTLFNNVHTKKNN
jgi:hypothetical protein